MWFSSLRDWSFQGYIRLHSIYILTFQIIIHPRHFDRFKLIASISCVWTVDSFSLRKECKILLKHIESKHTSCQQISIMNVTPCLCDHNQNGIWKLNQSYHQKRTDTWLISASIIIRMNLSTVQEKTSLWMGFGKLYYFRSWLQHSINSKESYQFKVRSNGSK